MAKLSIVLLTISSMLLLRPLVMAGDIVSFVQNWSTTYVMIFPEANTTHATACCLVGPLGRRFTTIDCPIWLVQPWARLVRQWEQWKCRIGSLQYHSISDLPRRRNTNMLQSETKSRPFLRWYSHAHVLHSIWSSLLYAQHILLLFIVYSWSLLSQWKSMYPFWIWLSLRKVVVKRPKIMDSLDSLYQDSSSRSDCLRWL